MFQINSLQLPSPELDDVEEFTNSILTRKVGSLVKSFRASDWPNVEEFSYKFAPINLDLLNDFRSLISDTLGLEVTTTDHDGIVRTGYIVPNIEVVTLKEDCSYEVNLKFIANTITLSFGETC